MAGKKKVEQVGGTPDGELPGMEALDTAASDRAPAGGLFDDAPAAPAAPVARSRKAAATRAPEAAAAPVATSAAVSAPALDLPDDFEGALEELEALVARLEDGSLPLEDSLGAYRRGVDLVRACQSRLSQAEEQVRVLEGELLRPLDASDAGEQA